MTWKGVTISPEDAQALEAREFMRSDIAGIFRVPPHKIADLKRSTNNNIEHQGREFYQDSILPWLRRLEGAANMQLLETPQEKRRYAVKFDVKALLRGDTQAQTAHIKEMFYIGVYSINDAKEYLDQNPIEGGEERFVPLNLIPLDLARKTIEKDMERADREAEKPEPEQGGVAPAEARFRRAYARIFRDLIGRAVQRKPDAREKYVLCAAAEPVKALSEGLGIEGEQQRIDAACAEMASRSGSWNEQNVEQMAAEEVSKVAESLRERVHSA
jgi:hypothetical protein